jgi:hypothetical protein
MGEVLAVGGFLVAIVLTSALGTWAFLRYTEPAELYGKPFRVCPSCGHIYDRPVDLFDAHIAVMSTEEIMSCPVCDADL